MASAGITLRHEAALSPVSFDASRSPHCLGESILIYLSVSGSSSMTPMRVLDNEPIASVKLRIQACKGFVVGKQRLVFDGRELARNDCLVRDYGVGDGNVLHLVLRLSDLRAISVRTACGKTFEFEVDKSRNVAYVKEQVAKRGRGLVNLRNQSLLSDGGEELDDQQVIDDISQRSDAVIYLLIKKTAKVRTKPVDKDFELSIVAPDFEGGRVLEELRTREWGSPDRHFWLEPVVGNPAIILSPLIKDIVRSTLAGLDKGNHPVLSGEGSGGAYFMPDVSGSKYVAVFKPIDEEPLALNNPRGLSLSPNGEGMKRGTRVGEGALREVAAYILDHPLKGRRSTLNDEIGFSGVPPTTMARCLHRGFNHSGGYEHTAKNFKIGSLQMFVDSHGSCEDLGPRSFPVEEVHKIAVLDIRLANTDRHPGNILFRKTGEQEKTVLIPIDHGYCLPENFEDCTFEWLYWPQARMPFNSETIDYINLLDAEQDIELLKFHGWNLSSECARTLRITTMLLKKGVVRGFTPFVIGKILCREVIKKKSMIEEIVLEAKQAVLRQSREAALMEVIAEIMDRRLDGLTP